MANKHMKRGSTSIFIREMQIKTTIRYHITEMQVIANVGENVEKSKHSHTTGGKIQNGAAALQNNLAAAL